MSFIVLTTEMTSKSSIESFTLGKKHISVEVIGSSDRHILGKKIGHLAKNSRQILSLVDPLSLETIDGQNIREEKLLFNFEVCELVLSARCKHSNFIANPPDRSRIPNLIWQWSILKKLIPELVTPNYSFKQYIPEGWVVSKPNLFHKWTPQSPLDEDLSKDHFKFCIESPVGKSTPIVIWFLKNRWGQSVSSDHSIIQEYGAKIDKIVSFIRRNWYCDYGEILFFERNAKLIFGGFSPDPIISRSHQTFKESLDEFWA